jgi:hypothetical protein
VLFWHKNLIVLRPWNIQVELPDDISTRMIGNDHNHFALFGLGTADTNVLRVLPHHLGELARLENATRFHVIGEFSNLVVPRPAYIFWVGLGVAIGRPETVEVLTVLAILSVGEAVGFGQRFGPVLCVFDHVHFEAGR